MDSNILIALIGASGTIVGAIAGALLAQLNIVDKVFRGSKLTILLGKWDSTWIDIDDPQKIVHHELFEMTRQKGSRVYGHITVPGAADKRWEFEGNFTGRFFQLYYYPSPKADDKLFLDYGCYFFDMQGDGTLKGYSVGFDYEGNNIGLSEHRMKKVA